MIHKSDMAGEYLSWCKIQLTYFSDMRQTCNNGDKLCGFCTLVKFWHLHFHFPSVANVLLGRLIAPIATKICGQAKSALHKCMIIHFPLRSSLEYKLGTSCEVQKTGMSEHRIEIELNDFSKECTNDHFWMHGYFQEHFQQIISILSISEFQNM